MTASLPRAASVSAPGSWPAGEAVASVTLAYADRYLRRRKLTADGGLRLLLDLPRPRLLGEGDGLGLDDGRWVVVRAASEPVVEARVDNGQALARLAWHVGNRHTACEILPYALRVLDDAVLADMLAGLGAEIRRTHAPFSPEAGAYARAHGHGPPSAGESVTHGSGAAP